MINKENFLSCHWPPRGDERRALSAPKTSCYIRIPAILAMLFVFVPMVFSQDNRVMCEVTESNRCISVVFGEDIKYLGSDYAKQTGLYDDNNQLKFNSAVEVVSFLCSRWGWRLCGNAVYKDNGKTKTYTLEHKIDNVLPNLWKQIDIFREYEKSVRKRE